jgi:hypothetical protein
VVETLEFQAEARQLLRLVVHSLYSNKDVFLRELISNASDALDRLRLETFLNKDLEVDTADLHIEVEADRDGRSLTVRDNGIGMSRDDVVQLICIKGGCQRGCLSADRRGLDVVHYPPCPGWVRWTARGWPGQGPRVRGRGATP